jgi:two-component system response regulator RegA
VRSVLAVLVVDDSPVVRRVLVTRVTSLGFQVREESRAAAAATVDARSLACAIIDLELEDGSGTDVATALAAQDPALPMAFFTGGAALAVVERARAFGPVFAKPDELDSVVAWIESAARKRE